MFHAFSACLSTSKIPQLCFTVSVAVRRLLVGSPHLPLSQSNHLKLAHSVIWQRRKRDWVLEHIAANDRGQRREWTVPKIWRVELLERLMLLQVFCQWHHAENHVEMQLRQESYFTCNHETPQSAHCCFYQTKTPLVMATIIWWRWLKGTNT